MMNDLGEYLDYLYPNPKCELVYHNDYELLIAIVLSAQTTDARVNTVTPILFSRFDNLEKLKNANVNDVELILKPIGSFRKKARYVIDIARILVDKYNCKVPCDGNELINFSGVGRKTVNVFLSEFYNFPAIGVDTHVERVSKRLKLAKKNDSVLVIEKKLMKKFPRNEWGKRHLQMVLFGRYHCKAIKPECDHCKIRNLCIEKKKI